MKTNGLSTTKPVSIAITSIIVSICMYALIYFCFQSDCFPIILSSEIIINGDGDNSLHLSLCPFLF